MKADAILTAIQKELEKRSQSLDDQTIRVVTVALHVSGNTIRSIDFRIDTKTELLR